MDQVYAALVELRNTSCQPEPTLFTEAWLFVKQLLDEFSTSSEHGTVDLKLLLAETDTSALISLKEAKRNHATSGAGAATTAGSARANVLKYLESQLQQREEWKEGLELGAGSAGATAGDASPAARFAVEIFELQREEDKYAPARQAALSILSTLLALEADAPGTPMDAVLREMLARAGELQTALRREKRAAGVRSELLRLIAVMVDRVYGAATKAVTAEAGDGTGPSAPLVEAAQAAIADLGTATPEALAQQALQVLDGRPKPKEVAGALSALER
ncbi:hypothetical protein Vafri_435, partial [Volvox africanus]